jgi:hypothetical protein
MTKEGQIIYDGPDHYARTAATKHFRDFLAAGRPALGPSRGGLKRYASELESSPTTIQR